MTKMKLSVLPIFLLSTPSLSFSYFFVSCGENIALEDYRRVKNCSLNCENFTIQYANTAYFIGKRFFHWHDKNQGQKETHENQCLGLLR